MNYIITSKTFSSEMFLYQYFTSSFFSCLAAMATMQYDVVQYQCSLLISSFDGNISNALCLVRVFVVDVWQSTVYKGSYLLLLTC